MGLFGSKCPCCKGKNLYLKRTWPNDVYGCKDCESKIAYMKKCGMTEKQIKKLFER